MNESVSELQNIWLKVKKELENNVEDSRFFDVFLDESSIYSIQDGLITVAVNSNLAVTILGTKYLSVIQDAAKTVLGYTCKLKFDTKDNLKSAAPEVEQKPVFFKNSTVNPSFTFDSFVRGSDENPNPIYRYSDLKDMKPTGSYILMNDIYLTHLQQFVYHLCYVSYNFICIYLCLVYWTSRC